MTGKVARSEHSRSFSYVEFRVQIAEGVELNIPALDRRDQAKHTSTCKNRGAPLEPVLFGLDTDGLRFIVWTVMSRWLAPQYDVYPPFSNSMPLEELQQVFEGRECCNDSKPRRLSVHFPDRIANGTTSFIQRKSILRWP